MLKFLSALFISSFSMSAYGQSIEHSKVISPFFTGNHNPVKLFAKIKDCQKTQEGKSCEIEVKSKTYAGYECNITSFYNESRKRIDKIEIATDIITPFDHDKIRETIKNDSILSGHCMKLATSNLSNPVIQTDEYASLLIKFQSRALSEALAGKKESYYIEKTNNGIVMFKYKQSIVPDKKLIVMISSLSFSLN